MIIGKKEFDTDKKTYVMGILNVTPDSFSDGGKYNHIDEALKHSERMAAEGAAILDVGGESTRPGYIRVSDKEEAERVVPVIRALKRNFDLPVSIDTYKSEVARAALEAGADCINDIWGLKQDPNMTQVAKEYEVPLCLMHNRKNMDYGMTENPEEVWNAFLSAVKADLQESIDLALAAGIRREMLILDPGIGFAKTYEMNLVLMNRLEELKTFGLPLLLGTSRKSMIGLTLDEPVNNRLEGTLATSVIGVMKGCSFLRVHDVLANVRAVKMTEAILAAGK